MTMIKFSDAIADLKPNAVYYNLNVLSYIRLSVLKYKNSICVSLLTCIYLIVTN